MNDLEAHFDKFLKEIFLPRFSEIELLTLFYLIFIFILRQIVIFKQHLLQVFGEIARSFIPSLIKAIESGQAKIWDVALLSVAIAMIFYMAARLVISLVLLAFTKRKMSQFNKEIFAYLFYTLLAVLSFFSTQSQRPAWTSGSPTDIINAIIIYFVLIRSLGMGFLTHLLSKTKMDHILGSRVSDVQIRWWELIILLVVAPFLFFHLRQAHGIESSIVLSHFYLTTAIFFLRSLTSFKPSRKIRVKVKVRS